MGAMRAGIEGEGGRAAGVLLPPSPVAKCGGPGHRDFDPMWRLGPGPRARGQRLLNDLPLEHGHLFVRTTKNGQVRGAPAFSSS